MSLPTAAPTPAVRLRRSIRWLVAVALLVAAVLMSTRTSQVDADGDLPTEGSPGTFPIVVELFTSQGCSSCPPADRLLSVLGEEEGVLPLSFHVDYWNYIGWTDPFSSERWSARQEAYARALRTGRVYTPQAVVDGRDHAVGSGAAEVRRMIAEARRRARSATVILEAQLDSEAPALRFEVRTAFGPGSRPPLDLLVALFECDLTTPVGRGENGGRTLHNDFVVRDLEKMASIEPAASGPTVRRRRALEPGWNVRHLGLVAFLQDPESLAIYGAAGWRNGRPSS